MSAGPAESTGVPSQGGAANEDSAPRESVIGALAEALSLVGDRWTLLVVAVLLDGPRRFGDLQNELGGIAPNVLSGRLQRLAADGLVLAEPYSERPQRFAYALTDRGRALAGPIRLLAGWSASELSGVAAPVHAACGSRLEAVWFCPTCQRPVDEDEASRLDYA